MGMEAEHCSESIHPVVNKLDRMFATTQNTCDRLALVTKVNGSNKATLHLPALRNLNRKKSQMK